MSESTHPYSPDPYIRKLAIQKVPCFGAFSDQKKTCLSCLIQTDCIQGVQVRKAELAAQLESEEQEAKRITAKRKAAKKNQDLVTDELVAKFEAENTSQTKHNACGVRAVRMEPKKGTKCSHCGEGMKKGAIGWWLMDNSGCYHDECIIVDKKYRE